MLQHRVWREIHIDLSPTLYYLNKYSIAMGKEADFSKLKFSKCKRKENMRMPRDLILFLILH